MNEIEYRASVGNADEVRMAIAIGNDVNAVGEGGYTAMHATGENNHVKI